MPNQDQDFDPGSTELSTLAGFGTALASDIGSGVNALLNFARVPCNVYAGKYTPQQIQQIAPSYALGLASLATPVGASMIPEDSLGIFAGQKSLTAPTNKLLAAKAIEDFGLAPETVYHTGWFRGADGQWRYTIPDSAARLKTENLLPGSSIAPDIYHVPRGRTLSQILEHPDLFAAYPNLASAPISPLSFEDMAAGTKAGFSPGSTPQFYLGSAKPENMLSSTLHEVQHSIQEHEGFGTGGNPTEFYPPNFARDLEQLSNDVFDMQDRVDNTASLSDANKAHIRSYLNGYASNKDAMSLLPRSMQDQIERIHNRVQNASLAKNSAFDDYHRLAGEVEARTVQEQLARGDWSTPPWQLEGYIPYQRQIVRTPQQSNDLYTLTPIDHDPFETR